ncbi:MAG TPA: glycosyltransferase family 39 protein, partial [Kofleriaceae bacterium]|nr:glycosyltransferase family 39 protein [Kofleriaceae bacterium]
MQFRVALSRWYVVLPIVAVLAAAVLVPGLGSFGLWEPQERQLADKQAPRLDLPAPPAAAPLPASECPRIAPKDALARTLVPRAMQLGRDHVDDSDAGRRLPFALLGILAVLATAGIAMRTIGARAGLIAAVVALSMPLFVLQSRLLTTEIGTATAGALVIYGLLALKSLEDVLYGALVPRTLLQTAPAVRIVPASLEAIVGALALAGGLALGFVSGGALLGVAVPLAAFAAAGALGVPTVLDLGRAVRNGVLAIGRTLNPRWGLGRHPLPYRRGDNAPALLATALAVVAIVAVVYQIFSLETPHPGLIPPQREVLGHAIVAPGCWSPALGGVWRPDDDLRFTFDSTFEQIAYGTFPWGVLAPIAFAGLLASADAKRRRVGAITLAWASAAWIATELFQRKVGFAIYAGFPALA